MRCSERGVKYTNMYKTIILSILIKSMQYIIYKENAEILNMKLNLLKEHLKERPEITVTYFVPDTKKDGGAYVEYSGTIRVIDEIENTLIFTDRTTINIEMVFDIHGVFLQCI